MPDAWNPGDDVVEVQRGPEPGGAGGAYRAFGETLRGLKTTFMRIVEGPVTVQYPEEKVPVYPRFRGRHKLHRFEDTGLEKCVGCSLCAAACPADCIRVVAAENTPENRISAVAVTMFLGGWHGPGPTALAPLWVLLKMAIFVILFIWVRATLPRLRYDQLMAFGWKVLLPLATLNALVTAIAVAT